jgi:predicted GTPase
MAPRGPHREKYASMVLLMGSTGSGKSFFANKLKEDSTVESDNLYSCKFLEALICLKTGTEIA